MLRYDKTFKFEILGIEINTLKYHGSRQTESNPGIDIIIESQDKSFPSGSFRLRSAVTFPTKGKKISELYYESYRTQDIDQAKAINMMIQLYEIVQAKGKETEKNELLNFRKHVEESLKKAFRYNDETAIQPLAFIVPGKRVDESTFELIDASAYQSKVQDKSETKEKAPEPQDVKEFKSYSEVWNATDIADFVAAVDGTRSHLTGRLNGVVFEYQGPSPELRQLQERFRSSPARHNDFFRPFANTQPARSMPESAQEDIISSYSKLNK